MSDRLIIESPVDLRLDRQSAPEPSGGPRVVVLLFDERGYLWVRVVRPDHEGSPILNVTADGVASAEESPIEAAYRILFEEMGSNTPLDEAPITDPVRSRDSRQETHVFIGHLNREDAPLGGVAFESRSVSELTALVDREPERFAPSLRQDLELAEAVRQARDAELSEAANRHPSSSWRDRPREQTVDAPPDTVDARITGTCQLRCDWCWGPEHARYGTVTANEWVATIDRLAQVGTSQIVISGGEPTLSKKLRPCVFAAKSRGMSVTLSSNGINLSKFGDVLEVIDDLGIPLDGSTPDMNDRMRRRSKGFDAWQHALSAMRLVQEMQRGGASKAMLTVRTVIARPNLDDVAAIPAALAEHGVDLRAMRLKLYQVEPFGPHFAATNFDRDWAVTEHEAEHAFDAIRASHPELHTDLQLYKGTVGRYFLVDPDGEATGTDETAEQVPVEVPYGNVIHDFGASIEAFQNHQRQIDSRRH